MAPFRYPWSNSGSTILLLGCCGENERENDDLAIARDEPQELLSDERIIVDSPKLATART